MRTSPLARLRDEDDGAAMMTAILIGAVVMLLGIVVGDVSLSNLKNAGRDRVAVSALGAAEAGVQQALAMIREQGVDELACSPTCPANPWGNEAAPMVLDFGGGRQARVWVEVLSAFAPPAEKTGRYLVHSEGTSGQGPGLRRIDQSLFVEPFMFPMGVYAQEIALNGTPQTFQQSVFSETCIYGREKMTFTGGDIYYGGKAAAFSAKYISEGSGSCAASNPKNIHVTVTGNGNRQTVTPRPCPVKTAYHDDRDLLGGSLSGTPCATGGRTSSYFDAELLKNYGGRLPKNVLDALRSKAQQQGNYWTSPNGWTPPDGDVHPDAVLYFKLGPNQTVNITNELNDYQVDQTTCTPKRTIIVVVDNSTAGTGGLNFQSGANLMGGMFVPNGNLAFRGTATFTGPLNSRTISSWNGNATSQLTACYLANLPGGLLDVRLDRFREVDR